MQIRAHGCDSSVMKYCKTCCSNMALTFEGKCCHCHRDPENGLPLPFMGSIPASVAISIASTQLGAHFSPYIDLMK
jgi:hypothetical protein